MPVTQSTVILGFTGPIGSGCSYIAETLSNKFGYKYFKLSNIIRNSADPTKPQTVESLQDKGNELRRNNGSSYLVHETFKLIENEQEIVEKIVIDGIKNIGEAQALRLAPNFFLFSVQANDKVRSERLIKKGIFADEDHFKKADIRDQLEDDPDGQQVKKCDYLSDIIILNDEDIPEENIRRKDDYINKLYWDYISPIEKYSFDRKAGLVTPTIDELCMTMAFSASKMSSCLKRKVGAVIIQENTSRNKSANNAHEYHFVMPNIVSSGYNDVPLGQPKCIFHPKFQMCYRDYLQEKHSKKLVHCPVCSKKIELHIVCGNCGANFTEFRKICNNCKNELKVDYKCECGTEIFQEFIPGAKHAPGKLLDMCRAIHAEEACLLNLIKNNVAADNLILYTTTQPCNLCANKIVHSGIRKVVFSEPYAMKESEEILDKGGVAVARFQGIKSNAFFKLYQS